MKKVMWKIVAGMLALLGGLPVVMSQEEIFSEPVGMSTLYVDGSQKGEERYSVISPTMVNPIIFEGKIQSLSAEMVSIEAAVDWGEAPPFFVDFESGDYYMEIVSGATGVAGAWTDIGPGPDAYSLTLGDDMRNYAGEGDVFRIRKHVTLGEFLGSENEAGLKAGTDQVAADEVWLYSNVLEGVYFYLDLGARGMWVNSDLKPAENAIIPPGDSLIVKRKAPEDISFEFVGNALANGLMVAVRDGINVLGVTFGGERTLDQSGLFTGDEMTGVRAGSDFWDADEVTLFDGSFEKTYFYLDSKTARGWVDLDLNPAGQSLIRPGTGIRIDRKESSPAFEWSSLALRPIE